LFYSSVAGVTVSAAGAAVSVATGAAVSVATDTFSAAGCQLHQLCQNLSESPSTIAAVTKDKILSIDLEASSFDGITNSTHEDQS
jgi:hypothetical protein